MCGMGGEERGSQITGFGGRRPGPGDGAGSLWEGSPQPRSRGNECGFQGPGLRPRSWRQPGCLCGVSGRCWKVCPNPQSPASRAPLSLPGIWDRAGVGGGDSGPGGEERWACTGLCCEQQAWVGGATWAQGREPPSMWALALRGRMMTISSLFGEERKELQRGEAIVKWVLSELVGNI